MSALQIDPATLPPYDKYSLIGIWISTMLYGINVILYSLCMYILLRRHSNSRGQWPLLATSTILYVLASLHIGASLKQLLDCFVVAPKSGNPYAGVLYWLDFSTPSEDIKSYAYTFIDSTQDFVLIWRLYLVWGNNWMIALPPFLLELTHFIIALYETVITGRASAIPFNSKIPIVAWSLVVAVNVGTTLGIAVRLWYMGRRNLSTSTWTSSSANRYTAPIFTMVESGALFTVSTLVLLGMFVRNNPRLETTVNVSTQLAATTPLLIIVRVGFGLTHTLGTLGTRTRRPGQDAEPHAMRFGVRLGKGGKGGLGGGSGGSSSAGATAVSAINVFRTVQTDTASAQSHIGVGSFKEGDADYPLDDFRGRPGTGDGDGDGDADGVKRPAGLSDFARAEV